MSKSLAALIAFSIFPSSTKLLICLFHLGLEGISFPLTYTISLPNSSLSITLSSLILSTQSSIHLNISTSQSHKKSHSILSSQKFRFSQSHQKRIFVQKPKTEPISNQEVSQTSLNYEEEHNHAEPSGVWFIERNVSCESADIHFRERVCHGDSDRGEECMYLSLFLLFFNFLSPIFAHTHSLFSITTYKRDEETLFL